VNLKACVNSTSRTSMEVGVRVDAENPKTGEVFHTASAYTTFVALGSNGKPAEVPSLILETEMGERFVGFSHFMRIFFFLYCRTFTFCSRNDFTG